MMERCALLKSPDDRARAIKFVKQYRNGTLTRFGILELERWGIKKDGNGQPTSELPQYCNQSKFADILDKKYGRQAGKTYVRMDVTILNKKWKDQVWYRDVFKNDGSVCVAQGLRRFEEMEAGQGGSSLSVQFDAKTRSAVAKAKGDERAEEEAQRKMDARWMLTEAHGFFCDNFGTIARLTVDDLVERKVKTAVESALKPHIADTALLEKIYDSLRPVYAPLFETWQADFEAKILEFDLQCRDQSEQKKARLKVK